MILAGLVPRILSAHALDTAHCDRLRDILERHGREAIDPAREAFRFEYLVLRDLLHRLELKEELGAKLGKPGASNGEVLTSVIDDGRAADNRNAARELDELLGRMTPAHFAIEI